MIGVKRYDISEFGGGMVEVEDGAWCHSDDYDRLKQECEQLRAFNLGLESEARRLFAGYMAAEEEAISRGKERDELRAQVEAMRKDADRYRWLRDEATPSWGCLVGDKDESAEQKDAEIDEAMRASL